MTMVSTQQLATRRDIQAVRMDMQAIKYTQMDNNRNDCPNGIACGANRIFEMKII